MFLQISSIRNHLLFMHAQFFHCLFFWDFKFCLNLHGKGTANGFVFDNTLFQEADILWLKDSISVVYNIFSLSSVFC